MKTWYWQTETPKIAGFYWTMQGGCVPVLVELRPEWEPANEEQARMEIPLHVHQMAEGNCERDQPLTFVVGRIVCWCGPLRVPEIPKEYFEKWRSKKPETREDAVCYG